MSKAQALANISVATTALDVVAPIVADGALAKSVGQASGIQVHSALAQEAIRASITVAVSEIQAKYAQVAQERDEATSERNRLEDARDVKLAKERDTFTKKVGLWASGAHDKLFDKFMPRGSVPLDGAPYAFSPPAMTKAEAAAQLQRDRVNFAVTLTLAEFVSASGDHCDAHRAVAIRGTLVIAFMRATLATYTCVQPLSPEVCKLNAEIAKVSARCDELEQNMNALVDGQRHIEDQEAVLLATSTRAHMSMSADTSALMGRVDSEVLAKLASGPAARLMRGVKMGSGK